MCKWFDDSLPKTKRISHLMKHFVNISLSFFETKSTLPSWYSMLTAHNRLTHINTHVCENDQHSQVDNIHVNQNNWPTQFNYSCMFKHNETIKIPLFIHTNSHACIQFFNSLTSTIISTWTPFICTCTQSLNEQILLQ